MRKTHDHLRKWKLNELTVVALYYHPDLSVALATKK